MKITTDGNIINNDIRVPLSKSLLHRYLIAEGLWGTPVLTEDIPGESRNEDVTATAEGIRALMDRKEDNPVIRCGNSGTTLRFLVPVAAALGRNAEFLFEEGLAKRPMDPLLEELGRHGCSCERPEERKITVSGRLEPGEYSLPGNISSQFVSGLMFALSVLKAESSITVSGRLESEPYVEMTAGVLKDYGIEISETEKGFHICPSEFEKAPSGGFLSGCEADWSAAAFFAAAGVVKLLQKGEAVTEDALYFDGNGILVSGDLKIHGLKKNTLQGDSRIFTLLNYMLHYPDKPFKIDIRDIPDLAPVLAVCGAARSVTTELTGIERLAYKESNRAESICSLINALGGSAEIRKTGSVSLVINGTGGLQGGMVEVFSDHRIAMAAAVAAGICRTPVLIPGAECVSKSFPNFWENIHSTIDCY